MRADFREEPRRFRVGKKLDIEIKDFGKLALAPDEMISFVTDLGRHYDVTRKVWGFYATPSLNSRLKMEGFKSALVRNDQGRCYVMLVECEQMKEFQTYLAEENNEVVEWLDERQPCVSEVKNDDSDSKAHRAESLERLAESPKRTSDFVPFWETAINCVPFRAGLIYRILFRMAGIRIGKNVRFLGGVTVKLRGSPKNIVIGNDVLLGNNVDLRIRENGRINLRDRVYLDENVRIVAAREGSVDVGLGAELGSGSVINSGGQTKIGKFALIANNVNINSSSHGIAKNRFVKDQPHDHGVVNIGDDVWLGSFSTVVMNTEIGEGAVIGANSVARGKIPAFAVCVGSPARVVRYRQ